MSDVAALNHLSSGKVRDIYAVGEDRLLLVASDRISTYDVVHPTPIPDKGKLLTGLTAFWLDRTGEVCPNHLISFTEVPEDFRGRPLIDGNMDVYQWFLMISTHSQRHILQIREVKAHKDFPKK